MFGLAALSTDMTIERDLSNDDVYTTRLRFDNPITYQSLASLECEIADVETKLPNSVKHIVFGCTSATAAIYKDKPCPYLTPLHSSLELLSDSIDLFTPYDKEVHNLVKSWFLSKNISISKEHWMGYENDIEIAQIDHDLLKSDIIGFGSKSGTVFLSCTALPAFDIMNSLPNSKIKYVSSNSSLLYKMNKIRRQNALPN